MANNRSQERTPFMQEKSEILPAISNRRGSQPQMQTQRVQQNRLAPINQEVDDGFLTFPDGSRYKGTLLNGNPEGVGLIIYNDGS